MKIMITGSRKWEKYFILKDILLANINLLDLPSAIVCQGGAKGADTIAKDICRDYGIEYKEYLADWDKHGKAAGPIRNSEMIDDFKPDKVLAFYKIGAENIGTMDAVMKALKKGIPVLITPG
jgi:hypothetical protein